MSARRLTLVDGTLALLSAAVEGGDALAGVLGVSVAEGWEGFPEALPVLRASYEATPQGHGWGCLFFIEPDVPALVGFGGFKGPPSSDGVVEIGYAIAPAFRGRGLATDAATQMVERALADVAVRAVDAHTLGHDNPSTRVLQKAGFRKIAEIEDPGDGPIWHWRGPSDLVLMPPLGGVRPRWLVHRGEQGSIRGSLESRTGGWVFPGETGGSARRLRGRP